MALVQAVDPRVSFAELQHWPEDGRRYELYDGEVIVSPAPYPRHQRVAQHLGELLREYELAHGGLVFSIPIDIVFTKFDVLQPDVVFFLPERCHLVNMMEATEARPDLAVEVLSRSTESRSRSEAADPGQLRRAGVLDCRSRAEHAGDPRATGSPGLRSRCDLRRRRHREVAHPHGPDLQHPPTLRSLSRRTEPEAYPPGARSPKPVADAEKTPGSPWRP